MVAVKSLLTLLALGAQALAATPSVVCATDLGTKSVKSIPTSTTTTIKKITVVKKIIRKVNVVVVPVAKTTTIRSTSTVTLTSFADEDVDTATETETSEIFTTQAITETTTTTQATTTTITEFTDTTVTTPDTYIPIVTTTYVRYRVKRDEKNAADVHLLSDTSSADPLYPQRVRCVKQVPSYSTKVVSTTVKGPRSTLKAVTKTTLVNIVTTTTTTVFPTDAPTTITVFDLPTITEYLRRVQTRALIQTVTVDNITPRDTIYAACQSNNILLTANRGGRVIGVSGDNAGSPPTVLSGSHTPESCCVECHKLPNCRASLLGKVAGLSSSTKNTCSVFLHADASKCNGAQPVFAEFVTSDNCPAEPQFIWSNGPCGQLVNGGDISVETV